MTEPEQLALDHVNTQPMESRVPPRPNRRAPKILFQAAKKVCEDLNYKVPPDGEDMEQYENTDTYGEFRDIVEALKDNFDWDGYHLARTLDDQGWTLEFSIVEALEETSSVAMRVHDVLVREWVTHYKLSPQHKVGTEVMLEYRKDHRSKIGSGKIIQVDPTRLQYIIAIEELGHGKPDVKTPSMFVHGLVINEEDLLGVVGETSNLPAL